MGRGRLHARVGCCRVHVARWRPSCLYGTFEMRGDVMDFHVHTELMWSQRGSNRLMCPKTTERSMYHYEHQ
jgi:hypothetical protein